ncbi:MAG TPA: response regulator [Candidatus Sutterella merdavium]|jgi:FixJ family two-component response regulator|nr:response regulator [Candidatus Sutterella merdavium]
MTRKTEKPLVRIVDDDPDQLASLEIMLSAEGWDVACYERASDFFAEDTPSRPGCLILDVRMPEISGLEMQEELNRREYPLPILFLTGHGDVDMAVHTLKKGAKDFLLKPVDAPRLLTSVATIVQEDCDQRAMPLDSAAWKRKFRELTEREQEIVRYVASGLLNRQIAERLGISERTVHAHRLSAYRKLNVHNVADLAPLTVLFVRKEL